MTKDKGWDASANWNGYMYQGKVALLIVLKSINEKVDITDYWLEMETVEDFAIGVGEEYETVHQVKNRKETGIQNYQEALSDIMKRIREYPNISNGYLHTKSEIVVADWKTDILETMMDYYPKKIQEIQKICENDDWKKCCYNELLGKWKEDTKQFDYRAKDLYKKVMYWLEKHRNIEKKENITIELFEEACKDILQDEIANNQYDKKEEAIEKIKIYTYSNNKCYADSCEIVDMTIEEIKKYWSIDSVYREPKVHLYYDKLLNLINENITNRAENKNKKVRIPLDKFQKIMATSADLICGNTKEEELLRIKYKYLTLLDDFCGNDICEVKSEENCNKCSLERISGYISSASLEQLEAVFRRLALHKPDELTKPGSELINKTELEYTLFHGLTEIDKEFYLRKFKILCQTGDQYMMATTISEEGEKRQATVIGGIAENNHGTNHETNYETKVCQDVLDNENYDTAFMEINTLLTKHYDVDDIFEKAGKFMNVDKEEVEKKLREMNITKSKKVRMISIENAKKEYGERQ